MPTLDACLSAIFESGNIPASSGTTPVRVVIGTLEDPDNYEPDEMVYSLDFTKFYNSGYFLMGFV